MPSASLNLAPKALGWSSENSLTKFLTMLATPLVSIILALSAVVSGASVPEIEPRFVGGVGGRIASNVGRMGINAIKAGARARPHIPIPQIVPKPAPAITGKQVGSGLLAGKLFGSKLVGGALVGFGSLGAQHVDGKLGEERRDLEPRNPQIARVGLQTLARAGGRVIRPNTINSIARPISRLAPKIISPPPAQHSRILGRLKTVGAITAVGLTAGAGEFAGGQTMGNMIDRLHEEKAQVRRDCDGELRARQATTILKGVGRIATNAARAGRVTGVAKNAGQAIIQKAPVHAQKPASLLSKVGKGSLLLAAAGTGGFAEGMIQNVTPEVQQDLAANSKGTIAKMLPPNPFGGKGKRKYFEELVARNQNGGSVERIVARTIVDLVLEDLE
ncbi:hypothetical protein DXG01_013387 [Tephrocybe rancida]|nr:hypothetical protein DXG01_013387 [Tephrocybe rancida]